MPWSLVLFEPCWKGDHAQGYCSDMQNTLEENEFVSNPV